MSNTIQLKRSDIPSKVPLPSDLIDGEIALNTADGKLYYIDAGNVVREIQTTQHKDYIYYMARSQATATAPTAITGGTVYEYVYQDGATTFTIYRYVSTAVNSRGYPDDWLYSSFVNPTLSGLLAKLIP